MYHKREGGPLPPRAAIGADQVSWPAPRLTRQGAADPPLDIAGKARSPECSATSVTGEPGRPLQHRGGIRGNGRSPQLPCCWRRRARGEDAGKSRSPRSKPVSVLGNGRSPQLPCSWRRRACGEDAGKSRSPQSKPVSVLGKAPSPELGRRRKRRRRSTGRRGRRDIAGKSRSPRRVSHESLRLRPFPGRPRRDRSGRSVPERSGPSLDDRDDRPGVTDRHHGARLERGESDDGWRGTGGAASRRRADVGQ